MPMPALRANRHLASFVFANDGQDPGDILTNLSGSRSRRQLAHSLLETQVSPFTMKLLEALLELLGR
jgi:hypothetical protein